MKIGKNRNSENITKIVQASRSFETGMNDVLKKSERRAWMITWSAITLATLLGAGYIFMIPLKKEVPYLVLADPQTGTSSVARLENDFGNLSVTASEAINKSNVAHFVVARESYDWDISGSHDWNTVFSMANAKVAADYNETFSQANPNNPNRIWGQRSSVRIKINSIVLMNNADPKLPPTGATVRFDRTIVDNQSARSTLLDSKIASLNFVYKDNLKMNDESRYNNPLGFQVTAYRVDNDVSSPSAAPSPSNTLPAATNLSALPSAQPTALAPAASADGTNGVAK